MPTAPPFEYDDTNPDLVAVVEALGYGDPNRYLNSAIRTMRGPRPTEDTESR